jgi:hypothetical protein
MRNILLIIFLLANFISYGQYTGAAPWSNCYGTNTSCKVVGCSDIKVTASSEDPVVAIVKKNDKVFRHAYISAGRSFTFELPDGRYQVFFYYGNDWDNYKKMSSDDCSSLMGGFSSDEYVSKDDPLTIKGQLMTYTLTKVAYGNFSPKSSNLKEIFD